ncbi:unnamed protein product [Phaeothamnion confervicola]
MGGKAAFDAGDSALCEEMYTSATYVLPANPQAWKGLCDCFERTGKKTSLLKPLMKSVEIAEAKMNYSRSRSLRLKLAQLFKDLGQPENALPVLRAFLDKAACMAADEADPEADKEKSRMRALAASLSSAMSPTRVTKKPNASSDAQTAPASPSSTAAERDFSGSAIGNGYGSGVGSGSVNGTKGINGGPRGSAADRLMVGGSSSASALNGSSDSVYMNGGGGKGRAGAAVAFVRRLQARSAQELRAMGEPERLSLLAEKLGDAANGRSMAERQSAAVEVAEVVRASWLAEAVWVQAHLRDLLADGNSPLGREAALLTLQAQCAVGGRAVEAYTLPLLPEVLARCADGVAAVRDAAAACGQSLIAGLCPHALRLVLPVLLAGMDSPQWRTQVVALELLGQLAETAPAQLSAALPEIVPLVSHAMWHTKREVKTAAKEALLHACGSIDNPDIAPLVPLLVSVIANPDEMPTTIEALLATTFVSNVDSATLAIIAPLLGRCLRERNLALQRKASRVIHNMCRLVVEPADVAPFVPLLLPQLEKVEKLASDREVASVAEEARQTLLRAMGEGNVEQTAKAHEIAAVGPTAEDVAATQADLLATLRAVVLARRGAGGNGGRDSFSALAPAVAGALDTSVADEPLLPHVAAVCAALLLFGKGATGPKEPENWEACVVPYLEPLALADGEAEAMCAELRRETLAGMRNGRTRSGIHDQAQLCDIEFSLAYGGKILLHNSRLRLHRGHRYGLIGRNGVGKTTLMRNIANGNIEGLPTDLCTVYVQHDIVASDAEAPVLDFMTSTPELTANNTRASIAAVLTDVGFSAAMQNAPVSSLSGGWKMRLALARAMLMNADVLLLDEPTNHLDTVAVGWLTRYLQRQADVTVLVVSHDTGFLQDVVTDILHYEEQKLVLYSGTLQAFVAKVPEAKHYYALDASALSFHFPHPGPLDGINSTTKSILTMEDVTYQYAGTDRPQLQSVSLKLCLGSRVGVVGRNGAGKSTLIKLIVRETEPTDGAIWAHRNLRVAYVAQHSFHHVEQHVTRSPVQYMQWRFGAPDGVDRELSERSTALVMTEEEAAAVGQKEGQVERILGRRKNGRTLEYEVSFVGLGEDRNKYLGVEVLEAMGLTKLVQQADARIAGQSAGLDLRPVTQTEIQGHLDDFGLDPEFGTHGRISGLSGGQKVKLVLAAAMWNRPHLLVLDEPTNYLDREALGALTQAIKDFGGGVIMISHNDEFLSALVTERWLLEGGRMVTEGEAEETALKTGKNRKKAAAAAPEEAANTGNSNKEMSVEALMNPKTRKPLSKKEVRKLQKCAEAASMSYADFVGGITRTSPEWKWL